MTISDLTNASNRYDLTEYHIHPGHYNAHRAFLRMKVGSVNYKILDTIFRGNYPTRKEINEKIGMPKDVNVKGYRSTTFARMVEDGLIVYDRENKGYEITYLGMEFLNCADR